MIVESLTIDPLSFAARTGWELKPEGMCRADQCVPLPDGASTAAGDLDLTVVAERLQMPLIHDEEASIWALGPSSGGRALASATAAELELEDAEGNPFKLSSLLGRKVLLVAWASW